VMLPLSVGGWGRVMRCAREGAAAGGLWEAPRGGTHMKSGVDCSDTPEAPAGRGRTPVGVRHAGHATP
jgi:hypothetical protein